jgi:uncharacterized protein
MQLELERNSGNFVRAFSEGVLQVGDRVFDRPVLISIDRIIETWAPPSPPDMTLGDLAMAIELAPEVIVLGTGARQCFPPATLFSEVLGLGIGLEVMDTRAACRTYNILVSEYRRVVAALLLR